MNNLLKFLLKNKHWFLFVLLEVISMVLFFQYNRYQSSVWFSTATTMTGKVNEISADIEQFFMLRDINAGLAQENHFLQRKVSALNRRLLQLTHDTTIVEVKQSELLSGYKLVNAKVVNNTVMSTNNYITIDKGSDDGIKSEMGVVSSNGVVGIVYLVSKHYSVIIPVLNTRSNISCRVRGHDYFGYLHWTGGSPRHAWLDEIPRHAKFKKGDFIETSGYSSVFPEGLLVGKVRGIYDSTDGLSYRLDVLLATNFSRLRDVSVIVSDGINEQKILEERVREAEKNEEEEN